jgi:hypothetical protein
MRRPPLVALLLFSLLGFSGCAGVSPRLDWSSPSTASVDTDETPAPNRFSWWRRPQAESTTTNSAGYFAQVNKADPPAASTKAPGNVWPEPEPKSDWMVRYFPHLSRLWNGNATKNSSDAEPASDVARVSSRPRPPAAARAGRADDDVRPVDASAGDDVPARDRPAVTDTRERFVAPVVPTPLLVRSGPDSVPERTSDVELDISKVDSSRESRGRSDGSETPVKEREWASSSLATSTPVMAMTPGDNSRSEPPAETSPDAEPGSASASIANPEPELAQAPAQPAPSAQPPAIPPPPPLNRTPPPPLIDEEKAAAKPGQPEAPAAPKVAEEPKPDLQPVTNMPAPVSPAAEAPPSSASPAPPVRAAADAPISAQTPARAPAAGLRVVTGSAQGIYASPPPMAPPQPRRRFLSMFFVEEKTAPLATPQFPAATFPAAYYGPYPRPYPVLAAAQANDVKSPVATSTEKKPCVLTVWFQKITSGRHPSGCTGCHHASPTPCCSGCTCYAGKNKSVGASAPTSLASPQGDPAPRRGPLSQAVPIGSTGPKPRDVAEEGKLFERVSFESFDKSPQS